MDTKVIKKIIIPSRLIYEKQLYKITKISKKYVIREYMITEINGRFDSLFVTTPHPNVNPKTNMFCIPSFIDDSFIDENFKKLLESLMSTFNVDNCYFTPIGDIEYRKLEPGGII